MQNSLVKISIANLPKLRNLFKVDWPKHIVAYYTIDNYIEWFAKCPEIPNKNVYSLNGDWSDGTFLIIDRFDLVVYSLEETNQRLTTALLLLDWGNGYKISSFAELNRPAVLKVIQVKELEMHYDLPYKLFFYPRTKAEKFDLIFPPGIILKTIPEREAETINTLWPYNHHGSLYFIKELIRFNLSIGAFSTNGELIGWCLRLSSGATGILQVRDEYKGKGIATLLVKAMAKKLAHLNMDSFAYVAPENIPSLNLFEKIGYKSIDLVHWIWTVPLRTFSWID